MRLCIRVIQPEEIKKITERNQTTRLDEYLKSLSKEEITKIMADQSAVFDIIQRLQSLLDTEYSAVYGGFYNGELISYVALTEIIDSTEGKKTNTAEIHVEVLPEYHGQGFGFEMLSRVIEMVFSETVYPFLNYTVIPSNVVSIALVEKLGGVLQEPKSYAEEMLLRTYHLNRK